MGTLCGARCAFLGMPDRHGQEMRDYRADDMARSRSRAFRKALASPLGMLAGVIGTSMALGLLVGLLERFL